MTHQEIPIVSVITTTCVIVSYLIAQYSTAHKYKNHIHELESECEALHKTVTHHEKNINKLLRQLSDKQFREEHHTPDCSEYKLAEPRDDSWNDMKILKLYDDTFWEAEQEMLHNEDRRTPGLHQS